MKDFSVKQNNKGFTLAELLVVVAIIGVLVAVSIPIFSSQRRKARLAVNQANARAAYSAAEAALLFEPNLSAYNIDGRYCSFFYDVKTGQSVLIIDGKDNSRWTTEAGQEAWLDYQKSGQRARTPIDAWTVDTKGDNDSKLNTKMGDQVFTRWKIDISNGNDPDHEIGALRAICWKE